MLGTAPSSNVDVDGHIPTKPNDVANYFADYFVTKVNILRKKDKHLSSMKTIVQSIDDNIMKGTTCSMALSPVCKEEVVQLLETFTDGQSTGYDFVDNKLLWLAPQQIETALTFLFN